MKLTIPQIIMMNHAAWVEFENADIRYKHKQTVSKWQEEVDEDDPILEEYGCRLSELTDFQRDQYLGDWSAFG